MFLHELKAPKGSRKYKKPVGRGQGSGSGKTSGRGANGQKSRSGRAILHGLEGGQMPLIRRLPKFGFRRRNPTVCQIVNLDDLARFKDNEVVTLEVLKSKGLIKSVNKAVKILGTGDIKKALTVQAHSFSKSAEEKIKQAGGKSEILTK
ncbi:MAG: 50S ribosomal protein L15 [Candidatus Omnitrophota bacterium]